ncbi:hypothetical protein HGRIS_009467 [Hohenbuehelia grisea]|uniref:N-acetyltransferase domain-containing protein n=1 Tax=Hohenbuehelia grisea TaxID=104357 RepID=A0ABR3J2P0_9AGAR
MPIIVRRATEADEQSLSRICLLTAEAGVTAEHLHNYGELPGLVYAVPYVKLPTTFGFVMEVEETGEVVGYVLASSDTRRYEQEAAEKWWPELQERYPLPSGDSTEGVYDKELKPGDYRYIKLLRKMHTAPDANIAFSPAHMHIDILEAYQRQGWGKKLIARVVMHLKEQGYDGLWVGLDTRNESAKKFYGRLGFVDINGAPNGNMGLKFADFLE